MPPNSPTAWVVARRLLAPAGAPSSPTSEARDASDPATTADRLLQVLAEELSRWFGPYGYHALLARALAETRDRHPVLAVVRIRSATEPWLAGLPEAAQLHGADAVTEGVATLLTALIDLLGRVIGEDLAVNLVSRAMMNRSPDDEAEGTTTAGGAT